MKNIFAIVVRGTQNKEKDIWTDVSGGATSIDPESMSNAFNFKDGDDGVTYLAPYTGATTYGMDMTFTVGELDNSIFTELFPNAKGGSVTEAPKAENHGDAFGHHDTGVDLVYIIQSGIASGNWSDTSKVICHN